MNVDMSSKHLHIAPAIDEPVEAGLSCDPSSVYRTLLRQPHTPASQHLAQRFLDDQLALVSQSRCELPADPHEVPQWATRSVDTVCTAYARYIAARKSGQPRRYFTTRGHALYFLSRVAPTKLVDGAWLYGTLEHWRDVRFHALIRTYLDELGNGDPSRNHVSLYQNLLSAEGCDPPEALDARYHVQGATQLALGCRASVCLPEVIGYNLGYEQLPLHLLITAYELRELGIDPHYFTLHVTIDNASTGHARQAAQALLDNLPATPQQRARFYRRVKQGYRLNEAGIGTVAVIESFDHEQEVVDILQRKSRFAQVHSDYCRIEGRTVNEWLADPRQIPRFLSALKKKGWIRIGEHPYQSRFWNLLQGPRAPMFGVFSPYELTIIGEWIAGPQQDAGTPSEVVTPAWQAGPTPSSDFRSSPEHHGAGQGSATHSPSSSSPLEDDEVNVLRQELERLPAPTRMQRLIELMAPGSHDKPAGLMATRMFARRLFPHLRRTDH